LSLFTLVGGHFFNRRLDLGLLYLVLLLVVALGSTFIFPALWFLAYNEQAWEGSVAGLVVIGMAVSMGLLLLTSLVVSFIEAGEALDRPPLGKVGVVAAVLATLLSIFVVYQVGVLGKEYARFVEFDHTIVAREGKEEAASSSSITIRSSFFHEMVRFGGKWIPEERLDPLPEGAAFITGRIRFEGGPVVGATLKMVINRRFLSKEITTDDQGRFVLGIPDGEWTVNRIEIDSWPDRPRGGSFTVTGGPNPVLSESMYHAGPSYESKGLTLTATSEPVPLPELELRINSNVQVLWPQGSRQPVEMENGTISWEVLEGADRYQLQLHKVERDGRSTSYFPTAWINTEDTEVPVSSFQTVSDETKTENEYAVDVYAFDAEGELLAGSSRFFADRSLLLKGRQVVSTHDFEGLVGLPDMSKEEFQESMEQAHKDKQRLRAADTLLREDLLDAARTLVERVKSESLEERKLRTQGMILAAEGRCEEARTKLEAANENREKPCFPEFFTERCDEDE
jgi:hypothetical protein